MRKLGCYAVLFCCDTKVLTKQTLVIDLIIGGKYYFLCFLWILEKVPFSATKVVLNLVEKSSYHK